MFIIIALMVGAFLGVVVSLWYNRSRKMNFDLPTGKIEIKIGNYKNSHGERMWQASASRGEEGLGRSFVFPSLKELNGFLAKAIELAKRGEDEGLRVETLFLLYKINFCCDGKKYHGNILGGEIWECIPDPNFPRHEEDGRCAVCDGWGCCACGHTGGY